MNNAGMDPIFNELFNNILDWDDANAMGAAPTFTGGSCGTHTAGNCSDVDSIFESDLQCTTVGGTVVTPASCTGAGTTKIACEHAGDTWTNTACRFTNQYQCELYGGTWPSDEEYKFPASLLGY